jgi:hypothetical protein
MKPGTGRNAAKYAGVIRPMDAAAPDSDPAWSGSGGKVEISGIVLNGLGGFPATITVPATYGHHTAPSA